MKKNTDSSFVTVIHNFPLSQKKKSCSCLFLVISCNKLLIEAKLKFSLTNYKN